MWAGGSTEAVSNELRERAQRMGAEARREDPGLSLNAAVLRIGPRVGVNADTPRGWIKRGGDQRGQAPETTSDAATINALPREVRELKRANEILLAASSFFARAGKHQQGAGGPSTTRQEVTEGRGRSGLCETLQGPPTPPTELVEHSGRHLHNDEGPDTNRCRAFCRLTIVASQGAQG